jgi:hypothetical protein
MLLTILFVGLAGIITGYALAPQVSKALLFRAYCKGKLSARTHREDEIMQLQRKVWRLEAITRRIGQPSDQVKA